MISGSHCASRRAPGRQPGEGLKRTARWLRLVGLGALMLQGPALLAQVHDHGRARLDLAMEGSTLTVVLEMPLDAVVGFERAPRTAEERRRADAALSALRDPARLFSPNPEAECEMLSAEVDPGVLGKAPAGSGASGEHADLQAIHVFQCRQMTRLRTLDLPLFETFARLRRVDAQVAGPQGQKGSTLTRSARRLAVSR